MEHNYLNYFNELRGLEPSQQYVWLGKAQHSVLRQPGTRFRLVGFVVLTLLTAALVALLPHFIGSEYPVRILGLMAGMWGGMLLFRRLYGALLRHGLREALATTGDDEPDRGDDNPWR